MENPKYLKLTSTKRIRKKRSLRKVLTLILLLTIVSAVLLLLVKFSGL